MCRSEARAKTQKVVFLPKATPAKNIYYATMWSHGNNDDEIMSNDESLHIDEESGQVL